MDNRIELMALLSNANGVSGFEDQVIEAIMTKIPHAISAKEDSFRNLYLSRQSTTDSEGITIMIDGHSDEVGFMIKAIKENGLMKFLPVGGWIPYNAAAQKVRVKNTDGKYISGIISSKPPHFMSEAERKESIDFNNLFIDVGATSKNEIEKHFKIEVGAPVVPDVNFEYNAENDTMIGKAFDNRIGCACVLETLTALGDDPLDVNVTGTISAQEETGLRGATITARQVKPDLAIVFEGTPADDSFTPADEAQAALKKGPQIRHMDRSMVSHPRFTQFARKIAKEHDIPFQDAVRSGGGTNGAPIHLSGQGVPTIVIGIPVRYIHTPYGIACKSDLDYGIQWATEIIKAVNADVLNNL